MALRQGWTEDELIEVLLASLSGYVGVPLIREAMLTAKEVPRRGEEGLTPLSVARATSADPGSGRSVTLGRGRDAADRAADVSRKRWAMVASSRMASIVAKLLPMHCRGPPPNGK